MNFKNRKGPILLMIISSYFFSCSSVSLFCDLRRFCEFLWFISWFFIGKGFMRILWVMWRDRLITNCYWWWTMRWKFCRKVFQEGSGIKYSIKVFPSNDFPLITDFHLHQYFKWKILFVFRSSFSRSL